MKPIFIHYPKCGTCRNALKWLKESNIDVEIRDIIENNPTKDELSSWNNNYSMSLLKAFNTSGIKYRELQLKDIVKGATDEQLIELLASDGKLVKRPVLVMDSAIFFGFKEDEWRSALL